MKVWALDANGDDYHGSRTVAVFRTEEAARAEADRWRTDQDPCAECGHLYWFSVYEVDFLDEGE